VGQRSCHGDRNCGGDTDPVSGSPLPVELAEASERIRVVIQEKIRNI